MTELAVRTQRTGSKIAPAILRKRIDRGLADRAGSGVKTRLSVIGALAVIWCSDGRGRGARFSAICKDAARGRALPPPSADADRWLPYAATFVLPFRKAPGSRGEG
jgi:hypothetical protein